MFCEYPHRFSRSTQPSVAFIIFKVLASSRDHQVELHERVQELLRCDATKSRLRRKQEQHVAAMIGQLEMDSSLIIGQFNLI